MFFRFFDVFMGYRKATPGCNGLNVGSVGLGVGIEMYYQRLLRLMKN